MRKIEWALLLAVLAAGCARPVAEQTDVVVFEKSSKVTALADVVDHIELVPLETGRNFLLGLNPILDLADDGYVLTDIRTGRILYFGADGAFRAHIGAKGRGPGEYPMLLNSQVDADGNIVAYSYPDKVLYFKTDGELLREEHRDEDLGMQSCLVPEGLLIYYGYGAGSPDRAALARPDGRKKNLLPPNDRVINMQPDRSVFSTYKDTVYFTDTYNPTVYSYKDGEVKAEMTFDFGKSAIDAHFYELDDPYASMDYILAAPGGFSLLRRYLRGDRYQFVEEIFQKNEESEYHYGVCVDGAWDWFSLGETFTSPFAGTMQVLSGRCLYFLLDSTSLSGKDHGLGGSLAPLRALISNPEVLEKVTPDDNPVVAKIYLD